MQYFPIVQKCYPLPPPPSILYIKNILEIIQKFSKNYWTKNAKLIESFFDRVKSRLVFF